MLRVGLTGGIGSGKTTVADIFRRRGAPIIDTDELGHELVRPGQPALAEIAEAFGPEVIDPKTGLDRARMRTIVFEDAGARRRLETILHPRIRLVARARVADLRAPYCLIVVPLLIETSFDALVDRVLVIDASEEQQIERATARDRLPEAMVRRIMAAQAERERRLAYADDVIDNTGDLAHLEREVERLDALYRDLSKSRHP